MPAEQFDIRYDLGRQIGEMSGKLDSLIVTLEGHIKANDAVEVRVRILETNQTRLLTIASLAGAALSLAVSKTLSLVKF